MALILMRCITKNLWRMLRVKIVGFLVWFPFFLKSNIEAKKDGFTFIDPM